MIISHLSFFIALSSAYQKEMNRITGEELFSHLLGISSAFLVNELSKTSLLQNEITYVPSVSFHEIVDGNNSEMIENATKEHCFNFFYTESN